MVETKKTMKNPIWKSKSCPIKEPNTRFERFQQKQWGNGIRSLNWMSLLKVINFLNYYFAC
jgi:hypothetical protein